ncbi:hypothetical protein LEP1GSC008_2281 [Leptospira kirschneri serovar Bulgarica str. Nikolaevo]|uniref:Leucine rich repeat protein n=2 Tax=Leptospira kirschneri TaxID=29507 RepID=A0A0E2B3M7_9LEPT|nr:hypothetical protein LEP1GSC081_3388 [Leptospira kirschneri str. H1]EMK21708.1 hypothetical protein LEP1GSC008_2281 [Leptospira kirschneri serovar Bulgarica str. Nikolaevo]
MKLTIGSIHLDSNSDTKVFLSEKDNSSPIRIWELSDFLNSIRFYECRFVITEVVFGFVSLSNINFLEYLPSVQSLWILTSNIKDFSALSQITNLKKLKNVSLRGCVFENLKGMMDWRDLKHLWLHGGKIKSYWHTY